LNCFSGEAITLADWIASLPPTPLRFGGSLAMTNGKNKREKHGKKKGSGTPTNAV
jgi:hypothetical protein